MILHSRIAVVAQRSGSKGLIKKNGALRDTRASDGGRWRRRWWATHLYLAQPIRAGLSTVKTSTLTTGDHNRAYLRFSQARALFFSPSSCCCTKGYLPLCSSIAPWRAIADFIAKLWTDPEERRSHERKRFVRRKREGERGGGEGRRKGDAVYLTKRWSERICGKNERGGKKRYRSE